MGNYVCVCGGGGGTQSKKGASSSQTAEELSLLPAQTAAFQELFTF